VRLLPNTPPRPAGRLDTPGFVRLAIGVPSIVFALAQMESNGSPLSLAAVIPLFAGIGLVCDFVRHALRAAHPLLDLRLYARRTFATGSLALFSLNIAWFGVFIILPLYFQQVRHASPAMAGLLLAPQGIGTLAGMVFARHRDHRRTRRLASAGVLALAVTTAAFSQLGASCPAWVICALLVIAGFGGGLAWVAATAAGYAELAPEKISHASPLVATTMRLGASFGTALAAIVLQHELNRASVGGEAHLVAAYHSTFQWAMFAALLALVMFIALYRCESRGARGRAGSAADADRTRAVRAGIARVDLERGPSEVKTDRGQSRVLVVRRRGRIGMRTHGQRSLPVVAQRGKHVAFGQRRPAHSGTAPAEPALQRRQSGE
jgi:hypothetical protein